jgi:hypothetical protein
VDRGSSHGLEKAGFGRKQESGPERLLIVPSGRLTPRFGDARLRAAKDERVSSGSGDTEGARVREMIAAAPELRVEDQRRADRWCGKAALLLRKGGPRFASLKKSRRAAGYPRKITVSVRSSRSVSVESR